MSVYRIKTNGLEPVHWKPETFANIGQEEWMKQILDILPVVDAGTIQDEQRENVKDAIGDIVFEGLMPAYLDLKEIRTLGTSGKPILDQRQPYEDMARKLWKSYKGLMQNAVRLMGFNIGFLFQDEKDFRSGLKKLREENPSMNQNFETIVEYARPRWQERLYKFRNSFLEHHGGARKDFEEFYKPEVAEALFDVVCWNIANILPILLELKLMHGGRLIEQGPNAPGPRWSQRFMYDFPNLQFPQ